MEIFQPRKDLSTISLEIEREQRTVTGLLAEKEVLVEDLKGYEKEGYEHFKTQVLSREKVRVAFKRMTIPLSEELLHARVQGQFNEVELLERNKEEIERDIMIMHRKITESLARIEELKKQLRKQSERK